MTDPTTGPDLPDLYSLFATGVPPPHELLAPDAVPEPYRRLLVHAHHMTVTVEAFYGSRVDVRVLERRRGEGVYCRKILLALQSDGRIVQSGVVRIRMNYCSAAVRAAILEERTPLGRILIENDVLRRIEPTAYFRVTPGPPLRGWFGLTEPRDTYGRLGLIHCDGKPAIELLEVLAPIDS